jgi:hypothetical protein
MNVTISGWSINRLSIIVFTLFRTETMQLQRIAAMCKPNYVIVFQYNRLTRRYPFIININPTSCMQIRHCDLS